MAQPDSLLSSTRNCLCQQGTTRSSVLSSTRNSSANKAQPGCLLCLPKVSVYRELLARLLCLPPSDNRHYLRGHRKMTIFE
ncbi:hypothetical protein CEXT_149141 [Caerostris extrusa]|uniref:Uncharacterized protein n=1 Tax=Caerostris extrusa TaxID=172846 RepID=A0AAV4TR57_CAEEX|nr:hypothetical protein CEXT_149141 [Caerostris extrusa]